MKTVAVIQARMGSTRLPGKVIARAAGKSLLTHMIERVCRSEAIDDIVVATCDPAVDILRCCANTPASVYIGSEDDVLDRVLGAAVTADADVIVELTGDCPLIDPAIIDRVVQEFVRYPVDFCANTIELRDALGLEGCAYARGMDVRVFTTEHLAYVDACTKDPADREHVSLYFWEHLDEFMVQWVAAPAHLASDDRLTVDTTEDLALVRGVFDALYPANPKFDLGEILGFLATQPDLRRVNRSVQQKQVR